ncbi:MAG TPA: M13 family peptidase, partial [Polyangia bacterium]
MTTRTSFFALTLVAAACSSHPSNPAPAAVPADAARPAAAAGIDLAGMDRAVAPGDDFFAYCNGTWLKTTEIPPDRSSYGVGAVLTELTAKRTADLIADAAKQNAPPGSDARKIGDYYASFLDEATIEQKGIAPIQPMLAAIAAIKDATGLARALGGTLRADVDVLNNSNFDTDNLFGLWVAQDLSD